MRILLAGLVALAGACASTVDGSFSPGTDAPPSTSAPPPASDPVTSVFVLDGDTFEIEVDGEDTEVRLLGINTPERDECFGAEARAYAQELTADADVSIVGSDFDQFGRLLAYVYTGRQMVNAELVASGHALALSVDHELRAQFKMLEREAAATGSGLWNPSACPPAFTDDLVITDLEYDAPGPDNENPNGEFIVLANQGAESVALAGWIIRDESSRHRYAFGELILEPGASLTVYSGCGDDSPPELYWCASDPVWSNGGDTAYLLDPSGNYRTLFAYAK